MKALERERWVSAWMRESSFLAIAGSLAGKMSSAGVGK
jgi:hypothetical protein